MRTSKQIALNHLPDLFRAAVRFPWNTGFARRGTSWEAKWDMADVLCLIVPCFASLVANLDLEITIGISSGLMRPPPEPSTPPCNATRFLFHAIFCFCSHPHDPFISLSLSLSPSLSPSHRTPFPYTYTTGAATRPLTAAGHGSGCGWTARPAGAPQNP